MARDAAVGVQIARLFQQQTPAILELVEPRGSPQPRDIPIVDERGRIVAYARPTES